MNRLIEFSHEIIDTVTCITNKSDIVLHACIRFITLHEIQTKI